MKKHLISTFLAAVFLATSLSSCSSKPVHEIDKTKEHTPSTTVSTTSTQPTTTSVSVSETTTTTIPPVTTTVAAYSAPKRSSVPVEASSCFKNIEVDYDYINYQKATVKVKWDKIKSADKYFVYVDLLGFTCDSTYKAESTSSSCSVDFKSSAVKDDKIYIRLAAKINGKDEMFDFIFEIHKKTVIPAETTVATTKKTKTITKKPTVTQTTTKVTTTSTTKATTTSTAKTTSSKKTTTTQKVLSSPNSAYYDKKTGFTHLGTAGALDGKTAVVSIFADSGDYSWDFSNSKDKKTAKTMCDYLGIATDWLEEQSELWGRNAEFIYDWSKYPQLKYETELDADFYDNDDYANWYYDSWEYVDKHIDSLGIKKDLNADNVIYLMFFNSPIDAQVGNSARGYYESMPYPYEVAWIHCARKDNVTQPAAIAHEMLHLFGAPDLYIPSNNLTTQEYADHMKDIKSNDIMYTTYEDGWKYRYDIIPNDITEITAYYLGWTDTCGDVKKWKLGKSQHLPYME